MRKYVIIAAGVLAALLVVVGYAMAQFGGAVRGQAASSGGTANGTFGRQGSFQGGRSFFGGPRVSGTVQSLNGDDVTITPSQFGSGGQSSAITTVVLTGSTQYSAGRSGSATRSSITSGKFIIAVGSTDSSGTTLTASRVIVLSGSPSGGFGSGGSGGFGRFGSGGFGPAAIGQVTKVNGDTFSITPASTPFGGGSSVTSVIVSAQTTYRSMGSSGASQNTVTSGTYIAARGTLSSDGKTLTATSVTILPGAPGSGGFGPGGGNGGNGFGPPNGGSSGPGA